MEDALEQVFPLAWSGIDLHKNTDTTWADVGGLDDVKQILTEIIIWPSLVIYNIRNYYIWRF